VPIVAGVGYSPTGWGTGVKLLFTTGLLLAWKWIITIINFICNKCRVYEKKRQRMEHN